MADGAVTSFPGTHKLLVKGVLQSQWIAWAGTTTGLPLEAANYPDKTLSISGTWGSATLIVEGSADGTTYMAVNDSRGSGNPISLTANANVTILENPRYLRAKTTGGTGTALTVTFLSQSTRR